MRALAHLAEELESRPGDADRVDTLARVHAVAPVQVFELEYAQARPSRRHRPGATLAQARVVRWALDAPAGGAQLASALVLS